MERPKIKDFFPPEITVADIMKVYDSNPELFKYIKALDNYIDSIEDQPQPQITDRKK